MGKVGAIIGGAVVGPVMAAFGLPTVFALCAAVGVAATALGLLTLRRTGQPQGSPTTHPAQAPVPPAFLTAPTLGEPALAVAGGDSGSGGDGRRDGARRGLLAPAVPADDDCEAQ